MAKDEFYSLLEGDDATLGVVASWDHFAVVDMDAFSAWCDALGDAYEAGLGAARKERVADVVRVALERLGEDR